MISRFSSEDVNSVYISIVSVLNQRPESIVPLFQCQSCVRFVTLKLQLLRQLKMNTRLMGQ